MEVISEIKEAVVKGEKGKIVILVTQALKSGVSPFDLFDWLIEAIGIVGDRFGKGELFLPELVLSANVMQAGVKIIKKKLLKQKIEMKSLGKIVIGTSAGDIHDIGKSIVSLMFEVSGFEVIDLGVNVPTERFVRSVKESGPDIVGVSSLLTTTMVKQKEVVKVLKKMNIRKRPLLFVGGAPVNEEWAKKIGADGYAPDAIEAVKIAKEKLKIRPEGGENQVGH